VLPANSNSTPLHQKTSGDNQLLRFNCGAIELHHRAVNQGNALGLEFVANAVCLGKAVYEQLAALESWLQFQHRSDRQTTQRFQGALQT